MSIPLAAAEDIIDASGIAPAIEDLLPRAARGRQLSARTLLLGMILAVADGRPAHLTRVRQALTSLPEADQKRLGVTAGWNTGPHQLTYRQPSTPPASSPGRSARSTPTARPRRTCNQRATSCWRPASRQR